MPARWARHTDLGKDCYDHDVATMNVSLPDELRDYVEERVRMEAYASTSEYLRELIRHDRDVSRFRSLIRDGMESAPVEGDWREHLEQIRRRVTSPADGD